jgi:hypothetical protein
MTDDQTPDHEAHIKVERGQPTDDELAAVIAVLRAAAGPAPDPTPKTRDLWGHPVDKLRYPVFSWQRVTLLERTHTRR